MGLAICHKMSDAEVQARVTEAANTGDWAPVAILIDAIRNVRWTVPGPGYEAIFDDVADRHHQNAADLLDMILADPANIVVKVSKLNVLASELTTLASYIANSPVNLFIGRQPLNASIQNRGDFNSSLNPNPVGRPRSLTPNSRAIYSALRPVRAALPAMMPISHPEGLQSHRRTRRRQLADWLSNIPINSAFLSSSGLLHVGYVDC